MKGIVAVLLFCIVLSGCGSSQPQEVMMDMKNDNMNHGKKPTLDAVVKIDGQDATVLITTDLIISKEHYGKEKRPGEGHIHMYLDNGEKLIVTDKTYVYSHLTAGTHTLKISLHNNDHTPYDVTKTITFEIK